MAHLDLLKSWIRAGADRASAHFEGLAPVSVARRVVRELKDQRTFLPERVLTHVIAHAPGVRAASVSAREGALHLDVAFEDEPPLRCTLRPHSVNFAARGAKEILLQVEPAEAVRSQGLREIVSALAGAIARQVWAVAVRVRDDELAGAIVDRDGESGMRVDLRSVPAVRASLRHKGPAAMMIEMLEIRSLEVRDGELSIELKLPNLL